MTDITVQLDVRDAQAKLSGFQKNQLPYALSLAVNTLAFNLMRAENTQITRTFKHPRPFTQKANQVERKATKASPIAVVSVRPAQAAYLKPYEFGGVHHLPGPALLNPKNINLDQYGQLRKGQIKALLAKPNVFAATIRGITGIWMRPKKRGQKLKLLVRLGKALPVHEHLHWLDTGTAMLAAQWPGAFDDAMKRAIATARL